jgi:hypothetical protein
MKTATDLTNLRLFFLLKYSNYKKMREHPDFNDQTPDEIAELKAADWQIEVLRLNPDYTAWGNFEDYMANFGEGWDARAEFDDWTSAKAPLQLDDLNELVNFYFEVDRSSKKCEACDGTGDGLAVRRLSDDWHGFSSTPSWRYSLTEIEVEALMISGRMPTQLTDGTRYEFNPDSEAWFQYLPKSSKVACDRPTFPTPSAVNSYYAASIMGHDSIEAYICIHARAKSTGLDELYCSDCQGHGRVYTAPAATLRLQLWWLHPRKGCSKGIYIRQILESELPQVYKFLCQAADRNADRFAAVPTIEVSDD